MSDKYLEQHYTDVGICPGCKGPVQSHLLYPGQKCPTVIVETGPIALTTLTGTPQFDFIDEYREFTSKATHAWVNDELKPAASNAVPEGSNARLTGNSVPPGYKQRAQAADPDDSLDILPYSNNFDCPKCGRQVDDVTFNDDSENGEFLVCECPCNITHYRRCRDYKP